MPDVVLFRTPTSPDTYTPALSAAGYTSVSIQALDDEIQTAELGEIVSAGAEAWQGVIITSRRGAEAWVAAVDSLSKRQKAVDYIPWSTLKVYSPGTAVPSVLEHLSDDYRPQSVIATSAAELVPLILGSPATKPYLMLVGDKSLPTLPDALAAAGRGVRQVHVYTTREATSLASEVAGVDARWSVLFSPSSSSYVLPHLEQAGWRVKAHGDGQEMNIAAIGETTAAWLREHGYRVDAVAQTPDTGGVVQAIQSQSI